MTPTGHMRWRRAVLLRRCFAVVFCCLASLEVSSSPALAGFVWSQPVSVETTSLLASVSCPSATFCAAVDHGGNAYTFNGKSWTGPTFFDNFASPTSVSCASSMFCVSVDDGGEAITFDGSSWSTPQEIANYSSLVSVSCPSVSFCAAVGFGGAATTYNGSSWSQVLYLPTGSSLNQVSCPSASFCAAVGDHAFIFDGSAWSGPARLSPSGSDVASVSCSSPSFCLAVTGYGGDRPIRYDGHSWATSATGPIGLSSVSCPSQSLCAATAPDGASTYTNGSWGGIQTLMGAAVAMGSIGPISCASPSRCVTLAGGLGQVISGVPSATSRTLTMVVTGFGSFTDPQGGVICSSRCQRDYEQGATVTLHAASLKALSSPFFGWTGGGCSGVATCTVILNADTTVTAQFQPPGRPACKVPAVRGKEYTAAELALTNAGCTPDLRYPRGRRPKLRNGFRLTLIVKAQSVKAGMVKPLGTKVRLSTVYKLIKLRRGHHSQH